MTKIILRTASAITVFVACIGLQACDREKAAAPAQTPVTTSVAPAPAAVPAPAQEAPVEAAPAQSAVSAEALEELLAPIALYPDGVLAQVLAASTKPQEVLDGGNWLLENDDLGGAALENAAKAAGFTAPMIALMQFPDLVDMMCMKMDWTTELGEAFLADEPAVLAAVQSLRKKAAAMGNLQNSAQLKVENQTMNNQEVITVTSPDPKVVYVPQYDPVTTYTTPAPAAPVAETGHSTGALIATGLLAFGAGILVNEAFDDDDDDDHYYPYWGGGGHHYYPPPYYPAYGNGFHPSHKYKNSFNNNNIYINNSKGDYWKRFDGNRPAAKPANWKGKAAYDGAKPGAREKIAQERKNMAGNNTRPATREIAKNRPAANTAFPNNDRGRQQENKMARPENRQKPATRAPDRKQNAFQGARDSGQHERAASQRGKASMQRQGGNANKGGQRAGGRKR